MNDDLKLIEVLNENKRLKKEIIIRDIEIARLQGYLNAYEEQIPELHKLLRDDCNCILCSKNRGK